MARLINIDNGGTLTDICVADADGVHFTKTLTTPFDLSECLFDGLERASETVYGQADVGRLLHDADYIRYSTTQGTNALVQRQGPRLGLLTNDPGLADRLRQVSQGNDLFDALVGDRVAVVSSLEATRIPDPDLVHCVNELTHHGAARLVVSFDGEGAAELEQSVKAALLRLYPSHLLGVVPTLVARDLCADQDDVRRTWSALLNSFVHPSMERFLFHADQRLQEHRTRNPLLVFRNDGGSSRVSKASALKTYSSGPRGGLEGVRALADYYALAHVLMADVGGTTTDVGIVEDGQVVVARRGPIEGIATSYELSDISSHGAGGSSVIRAVDSGIQVGPDSVGAAPGPACFGLGGSAATITDVLLLMGVLDPATYLGGRLQLDPERSRTAVMRTVGEPLGLELEPALLAMRDAFATRIAELLKASALRPDTVLASFGGGGPMVACDAARRAGIRTILVPRTAAVFSAFGIGFSDLSQTYEHALTEGSAQELDTVLAWMRARAARDFAAEHRGLDELDLAVTVISEEVDGVVQTPVTNGAWPEIDVARGPAYLALKVTSPLTHVTFDAPSPAGDQPDGTRDVLGDNGAWVSLPVRFLSGIGVDEEVAGPLVLEGPFFTMPVPDGWTVRATDAGDLLLTDQKGGH